MSDLPQLYLVLGGVVLVLSLLAEVIRERLWISEPLAALAIGLALGPAGFGVVDVPLHGKDASLLEHVARLTVALSVMGVVLRLPDTYLVDRYKTLAVMLAVVMPLTWLIASFTAWLTLGMPLLLALWMGAVVTPTDPVLADGIVTGPLAERSVDVEVRSLISAEAGANDGLAYLFVMLPVTLLQHPLPDALGIWAWHTLIAEVGFGLLLGAVAGCGVGQLVRTRVSDERPAGSPLLAIVTALTLVVLGGARLLGADGLVAVFAAGLGFNWMVRGQHGARQSQVQEVITRFFDAPVFILLGLAAPLHAWFELGWAGLAFAGLVLSIRRLPVVLLVRPWLSPVNTFRQAAFAGWFGPIGAAALVYATWARTHEHRQEIWTVGSLVVCASVFAHGITATPLTRWFARVKSDSTGLTPIRRPR